jgi:metal-responsive CopG/Arc/MetJ family transcriptional regulator
MESKQMAKRISITFPDAYYEELSQWADERGEATASLAIYLIRKAIDNAKDSGELVVARNQSEAAKKSAIAS